MTTPTGLDLVWADAGGFTNPGDSKYQLGWIAEIPTFQNFNYVLQALDRAKLSYAEKDIHTWNDKISYVAGARVERGDKTFYCKTPHNLDPVDTPDPQDPTLDTTGSYWVNAPSFSSAADAFTNLDIKHGLTLDRLQARTSTATWQGNDATLSNNNDLLALNQVSNTYDNLLFGNVRGQIVVINVGNATSPDGRDLRPANNPNSYQLFHEGNPPTQTEVDGTIPKNPEDGKLYARQDGNWVEVTATTVSPAPASTSIWCWSRLV